MSQYDDYCSTMMTSGAMRNVASQLQQLGMLQSNNQAFGLGNAFQGGNQFNQAARQLAQEYAPEPRAKHLNRKLLLTRG